MSDNICSVCNSSNGDIEVTKQRCDHIICWKCLDIHVSSNMAPKIKCPISNCGRFLSDGAIRKVLSDENTIIYEQLSMGLIPQKIKCMLPGCHYFFICTDTNIQFECTECELFNCVACKAPHRRLSCDQFRTSDIAPGICQAELTRSAHNLKKLNRQRYRDMFIEMDENDLLIYDNLLECPSCSRHLAKGDGVLLRCTDLFCRHCLGEHIKNSSNVPILCPSVGCNTPLEEREILKLINEEDIAVYVDRCNSTVKGKLDFVFQCQTPNCLYFVTYSKKPDEVHCPLCKFVNCTKCYVIHANENCDQFKERIKSTPYGRNLLAIEEQIQKKELMRCLKCNQLLKKISGCSWIQCSNCRFEMCWALQMRRWGPGGRGDESDGCGCQLMGPRCAPDCGSCEPHHGPGEQMEDRDVQNLLRMLFMLRLQTLLENIQ